MIKENFIELYENSFKNNWELPALSDYSTEEKLLYQDLAREIAKVQILFEAANIQRGDKIALVGKNNIAWCVVYLAVINYGAIIVPILQDFPANSIQHIIHHSDSVFVFTNENIWDSLDEQQLPLVRASFSTNSLEYKCLYEAEGKDLTETISELDKKMTQKYPDGFKKEDIKYAKVDNSELVLISYTSGTTGFSKGVMLTANNLAGNVTYAHHLKLIFRGDRMLSFLPLAHAYGCAFEFLYALTEGAHTTLLGKVPSPKILAQAFADIKPHIIISVPLVIEKIYKKALLPKLQKPAIKAALKIPIVRNKIHAKFRKGLMDAMGGNFNQVVIGGAALNSDVEKFLHKIKFPYTVGYGMTECAPLISYDHHHEFVLGSCGRALKNIMEIRIDSEDPYNTPGEIQVHGENVMLGYYKNEDITKETFTEDGWFRTGDLGTIDKENRIFIRGRSKTMILGASGQNIFPEEIESHLNNLPYVAECLVVSRNNRLIALVCPDYEEMDATGVELKEIDTIMEANRKELNQYLSSYEAISAIQIFPNEFEKTPKKSIKRYLYEN